MASASAFGSHPALRLKGRHPVARRAERRVAIWTRLLRLVDARLACVRLDETHTVALVLEVGERSPAIVFALLFGAWNGAWADVRLEREVRLGGIADPGDAVCPEPDHRTGQGQRRHDSDRNERRRALIELRTSIANRAFRRTTQLPAGSKDGPFGPLESGLGAS